MGYRVLLINVSILGLNRGFWKSKNGYHIHVTFCNVILYFASIRCITTPNTDDVKVQRNIEMAILILPSIFISQEKHSRRPNWPDAIFVNNMLALRTGPLFFNFTVEQGRMLD